jgi:hypothetical protein
MSLDLFAPVDPALIDVVLPEHDGYPDDIAAGDTKDVLWDVCGDASREFPQSLWIEPSDWPDAVREAEKNKSMAIHYVDRFTNQDPTHECTCHSLRANYEAAWNRTKLAGIGPPQVGVRIDESSKFGSVWVSPLSVYAEANPRKSGGAGVRQVLEIALRRGFLPEPIQPRDYKFKHTLHGTTGRGGKNQSRGEWVPVSRFPDGWEETAKHFKPDEVIFCDEWEQAVCLVIHGYAFSVGRSGHAIPWTHWNPTSQAMGYVDSYDVIRWDSKRTVQSAFEGGFAIATVVVPNDWDSPAGAGAA